jgi:L-iditol 2-dehydrogenase
MGQNPRVDGRSVPTGGGNVSAENRAAAAFPSADTMRALILQEPGCLRLSKERVPSPGPGEVLLRVSAATTCGTDLKAYLRGHPQIPMPGVFGHEYCGEVVEVGEGAPFSPGDAVMGVHSAPCQSCYWCERDQENLCESIMATKVLGSYAEYLRVPAHVARLNLFERPTAIADGTACLLEPLSCVAQAIELMPRRPDTSALIIGPGAIGLMFVAALRHQGIADVTLAGRNPARLEVGERLGAGVYRIDEVPTEDTRKYDLVVECTGIVDVWERSVGYVRRGGTLVLFGGCPAGTRASFDTRKLHYDQIAVLSPFHFGTRAVRTARDWLLEPSFDLSPLISGERGLDEGEATFEDLRAGRGIKFVFRP